ncbi:MAG: hypothetical protein KC591_00735, partial [Gemmatimonadetes bacterium]|nr:hypothetical protein [Gemmatimonadota bacterium]
HTTVMRIAQRLARHCLLYHWHHARTLCISEGVVIDGFETFAHSQFYPCHLNLAVGARSHFTYSFTEAELRRKGRMTDWQRARRGELEAMHGRPDTRAIEKSIASLVTTLPVASGTVLRVHSDEHRAYPRAFRRIATRIEHSVTSSRAARVPSNPLFPVNLADLLLRHSSSNHKRETIAFSKTMQAAIDRLAIFVVWRNWAKSFSERLQDATPAMRIGLARKKHTLSEIVRERLFVSKIALPVPWYGYYRRRVVTRPLGFGRPHRLRYAD